MTNFTYPIGKSVPTYPPNHSNAITKEYYNFFVGEINRGTILKAVCKIEDKRFFNAISYYLISEK